MDPVNGVVLVALVEYMAFIAIVGFTRDRYGVPAPATTGDPQWERLHRIQVNTAEQLIVFLPAIYAFAHYVSVDWAAGIGLVFVIGRVVYFYGYRAAPEKRVVGAAMSTLPTYVLLIGAIVGWVGAVL